MGGRYVRCAILGARDGIYFLCIWNSIEPFRARRRRRSPFPDGLVTRLLFERCDRTRGDALRPMPFEF